jgi:hypothetical protein
MSLNDWANGAIAAMAPNITRSSTWEHANAISDPYAKLQYLLSQSPPNSDQYPLYQSYVAAHPQPAATSAPTPTTPSAPAPTPSPARRLHSCAQQRACLPLHRNRCRAAGAHCCTEQRDRSGGSAAGQHRLHHGRLSLPALANSNALAASTTISP